MEQWSKTTMEDLWISQLGRQASNVCYDQDMQGNLKVIQHLNRALKGEFTAIHQYIVHAEMCDNWGYGKLGAFIKQQAIGEMRHAEMLIERILFLEGVPGMGELSPLNIGQNVKDQLFKRPTARIRGRQDPKHRDCGRCLRQRQRFARTLRNNPEGRRGACRLAGVAAPDDWRHEPRHLSFTAAGGRRHRPGIAGSRRTRHPPREDVVPLVRMPVWLRRPQPFGSLHERGNDP